MERSILVLGATSAIARGVSAALAAKGHPLFLASRDEEELDRIARDLRIRFGVEVECGYYDIEDFSSNESFLDTVLKRVHGIEGVVFAIGDLGKHDRAIRDFSEADRVITRNFTGACAILSSVANFLERQKRGFLIGITSVAGERGRQSNYIYGAAKGGLAIFLQGLRNRLHPAGVQVLTVKPGFVDTAMTFGLEGLFLLASPDDVGRAIVKALGKSKDEVYVPWFWRYIMMIIKAIPEKLFKRLKL